MRTVQPPKIGKCYCGKHKDVVDRFLGHHSCGNVCGKFLEKSNYDKTEKDSYQCRHKCSDVCHPGPCATCKAMAPRSQT